MQETQYVTKAEFNDFKQNDFAEVKKDIREMRGDIKDIRIDMAKASDEFHQEISKTRDEMNNAITKTRDEMHHEIGAMRIDITKLDTKFNVLIVVVITPLVIGFVQWLIQQVGG
jgi:uncharacterized coiled-coil DUF342 family protein